MPQPAPRDEKKAAPRTAPAPVAKPAVAVEVKVEMAAAPVSMPSGPIGRAQEKGSNIEDILSDIFQESMDLWNTCKTRPEVASFMLELAMRKIKAESGGFLYGEIDGTELTFLAARGPKASDVLKFKVPVGAGIVGFCVQAGVSLSISDVERDPRWYGQISKSMGYSTRSILCAVVQQDGQSLGAIELINKAGGNHFSLDEMNIMNYIAHEAGEALARISDEEFAKKGGKDR